MATKYEKLEAEYQQLSTPEQQWAWVLAHKDEIKVILPDFDWTMFYFKKAPQRECLEIMEPIGNGGGVIALLSVLGIEVEES